MPFALASVRVNRQYARVDVEWPDRREDVLNALDTLAAEPPTLSGDELDPRWLDLTNAVHWLVDDTFWDQQDPRESIGTLLRSDTEAVAVEAVVGAIVAVSERQTPGSPDADWFADPDWARVRTLAAQAAATFRA